MKSAKYINWIIKLQPTLWWYKLPWGVWQQSFTKRSKRPSFILRLPITETNYSRTAFTLFKNKKQSDTISFLHRGRPRAKGCDIVPRIFGVIIFQQIQALYRKFDCFFLAPMKNFL